MLNGMTIITVWVTMGPLVESQMTSQTVGQVPMELVLVACEVPLP